MVCLVSSRAAHLGPRSSLPVCPPCPRRPGRAPSLSIHLLLYNPVGTFPPLDLRDHLDSDRLARTWQLGGCITDTDSRKHSDVFRTASTEPFYLTHPRFTHLSGSRDTIPHPTKTRMGHPSSLRCHGRHYPIPRSRWQMRCARRQATGSCPQTVQ